MKDKPILTTDHPASSYGQPVLIVDGNAYGPADYVPGGPANTTAHDVVDFFYADFVDRGQGALADKFLKI